ALEGNEWAVRSFLGANLTRAVEQDDRSSVGILSRTTKVEAQRKAAVASQYSDYNAIKEFLRTEAYPGKADADRQEVNRVMAAAGSDSVVYAKGNEALNAELAGNANALHDFLKTGRYAAALHDDRKAVNKALENGDLEVKAAAQAALSGPDSYLATFLLTGLPKAQLADADRLKHEASIDAYLAKADQSASLARENAEKAAEWAAIARKAADEAAQWRDKAAASNAAAQESARQAQSHADAAQRSADQAAASAKRARDAAAQADRSASSASASAANASASATYANSKAAEAKQSADAARQSANEANEDAKKAQEAADQALQAAEKFANGQEKAQNTPEPVNEREVSPFGIEKVPENLKDDPREVPGSMRCSAQVVSWFATITKCSWKIEHHITGTMRFFTFQCPDGATAREQCTRVEVGTSPIDFRVVREHGFDSPTMTAVGLAALADSMINDFRQCAWKGSQNFGEQGEACAWTAMAIFPPAYIGRYAKLAAFGIKSTRISANEVKIFLLDDSYLWSEINEAGHVDIIVKVAKTEEEVKGRGRALVHTALAKFGGRITQINGTWIGGGDMADNLITFNKVWKETGSKEIAAQRTFTGKMAGEFGFTEPKNIRVFPKDAPPGEATSAWAEFVQP
ncbi:MAG TPA: hypothetical protein VF821_16410, partial [Lentzea sp.]